jgi:hypothetical protein
MDLWIYYALAVSCSLAGLGARGRLRQWRWPPLYNEKKHNKEKDFRTLHTLFFCRRLSLPLVSFIPILLWAFTYYTFAFLNAMSSLRYSNVNELRNRSIKYNLK